MRFCPSGFLIDLCQSAGLDKLKTNTLARLGEKQRFVNRSVYIVNIFHLDILSLYIALFYI